MVFYKKINKLGFSIQQASCAREMAVKCNNNEKSVFKGRYRRRLVKNNTITPSHHHTITPSHHHTITQCRAK